MRAARVAIADVLRIEAKFTRYRDDSVTAAINRAAGGSPVAIDAETAALLRYADRCHRLSGARFDLTSGVLRRAWDFRRRPPLVPTDDEIAAARELVGWERVEWDDAFASGCRARGMELDFGGIGKEYAADRAATICVDHGIAHGLVNLGGDVRVIGTQPDGAPWRIGIRHPRSADAVLATVELSDGAVATSGDYERYFEVERTPLLSRARCTHRRACRPLAIGQRDGAAGDPGGHLRDDRDAACARCGIVPHQAGRALRDGGPIRCAERERAVRERVMNTMHRAHGVLAPVVTPFTADLRPDAARLVRHCRWLLEHDVGLAVFGTNSEANSLSVPEKLALLDVLREFRHTAGPDDAGHRLLRVPRHRRVDAACRGPRVRGCSDAAAVLLQDGHRRRVVRELRRSDRARRQRAFAHLPLSHPAGVAGRRSVSR